MELKRSDIENCSFQDTSFDLLMGKRIEYVLLICSTYDAFILEEDGRINEAVFQEYNSLNLRYPPKFIKVHDAETANEVLNKEKIDLVINMLSIYDQNPFELSKEIKSKYCNIPIVVLTPFSREVSRRLADQDLSGIDYVFSWLGNTNLLLAIIKLIEDKMNLEHDVGEVGVQCVLLVEDSVRYYSSYLPNMYRIVIEQSRAFMTEGLNEHQMMLRFRGRPKILLATNFEQALELYEKYKTNMLGMISDVSFNRNNKKMSTAGIELCKIVKSDDPFFPVLLQSSDDISKDLIDSLKIKFVNKFSKTLLHELTSFLANYLAFGGFRIIDPMSDNVIMQARDLQSLHEIIYKIPDEALEYHIRRNHFSKWLRARALFSLARLFREASIDDFSSLSAVRDYLHKGIAKYRNIRGRGVISTFNREKYNEYLQFVRLGQGSLGGKARGLAFIDNILKRHELWHKYDDVELSIPRTIVIATEVFSDFMNKNKLYDFAIACDDDNVLLEKFINSNLNDDLIKDLKAILEVIKKPIAVRSSSLLEDSHYQPFAGIYSTYLIPNTGTDEDRLNMLMRCIKAVYASVYYQGSKSYMSSTSNIIDEEKMAVILQEVCGSAEKDYFFPIVSGVARSINFYPISPEKAEEGVVNIAYGLGKYVVDGGISLRFSPKYPEKILQLSSPDLLIKDTQKDFMAINLKRCCFMPNIDDNAHIEKFSINQATDFVSFKHVASTFVYQEGRLAEGVQEDGLKIISFNKILKYNTFPLANMMREILALSSREMGKQVEIEFALDMSADGSNKVFNLLQIRPIVDDNENIELKTDQINRDNCLILSELALGNGVYSGIFDLVYIVPELFNAANTHNIASEIEKINQKLKKEDRNYVLVGPGRWGSSDSWLGIPVKWAQISAAKVIVEAGMKNFHIEPSQGTHFFQNLTSFQVTYLTVNDFIEQGYYNIDFLNKSAAIEEKSPIRHLRFDAPLEILVDGKTHYGIISLPGKKSGAAIKHSNDIV